MYVYSECIIAFDYICIKEFVVELSDFVWENVKKKKLIKINCHRICFLREAFGKENDVITVEFVSGFYDF